jgi:NADH dehydrogenase
VAPVAMQEGMYIGRLIRQRLAGEVTPPFHYFDKGNLATIGRTSAIADLGWIRLWGLLGWVVWAVVHILYLISFRNRLLVMVQWAWAYFTQRRGAQIIAMGPMEKAEEMGSEERPAPGRATAAPAG